MANTEGWLNNLYAGIEKQGREFIYIAQTSNDEAAIRDAMIGMRELMDTHPNLVENRLPELFLARTRARDRLGATDTQSKALPFYRRFYTRIANTVSNRWELAKTYLSGKMDYVANMSPGQRNLLYVGAALLGALVLFSVYKLIRWVLSTKEEKNVDELNENYKMFWGKLKEGDQFTKSLFRTLREDDSPGVVDSIILKAKTPADDALALLEDEEKKEATKKSIIKRYAYMLLSGLVLISSIFVYWYFYAKRYEGNYPLPGTKELQNKISSKGETWFSSNKPNTPDPKDRFFQSQKKGVTIGNHPGDMPSQGTLMANPIEPSPYVPPRKMRMGR